MDYTKLFKILDDNCPHTMAIITEETELYKIYESDSEEDILSELKKTYKIKIDIKSLPEYEQANTVKDLMNVLDTLVTI